jgi:hypothetical protein
MENKAHEGLIIYAIGDVAPIRAEPASIFDDVKDTLNRADSVFCQLEINIAAGDEVMLGAVKSCA